jgi:two-component system, cell cycle response regulator
VDRHSVLLVDDERFERQVYADYLSAAGYEVVTAESAEDALTCLSARAFDVLVTDMILPGSDGLQLLSEAKLRDPDVEVVMITAVDRVDTAVRAMKSGASDYLVKPVSPEALQVAVQRCLQTRLLLAENKALRSHLHIFETCQRITASLERDKVIPMALAAIAAECGAARSALLAPGPRGWAVAGTHALSPEDAEALLAAAAGAIDRLDPAAPVPLGTTDGGGSGRALLLPVAEGGELAAAACLPGVDALPAERAARAALLCRHLAIALRTLSRLSQVERLAYVDDLTHLHNTRYLDLVLEREIQAERSFTLLFLDLDRLKAVNDQHGHLIGSRLLVEVAKVLKSCVRDEDVLVRYGGDEYVVVLLGTDSGGALKVAERIRRAIEDHAFLSREGPKVRVTTSIGVASYPEHAESKAELLDLADRAMYRGKRTSRNVVYVASQDLPPRER